MSPRKLIMLQFIFLINFALLFGLPSCKNNKDSDALDSIAGQWFKNPDFPYNLKKPSQEFKMQMVLKEISGLDYDDEKQQLIAINDELGNIYFLDKDKGIIEDKIRFQRFGDYEAVEKVGDQYFVCNSKGDLRLITPGDRVKVELLKTELNYKNNVEGMGYNEEKNELILACKDDAQLEDEKKKKGKAIYRFSLDKMELEKERLFVVRDAHLVDWIQENVGRISLEVRDRVSSFSPSGIAIHPFSKHLYITSARGDLVAVFDQKGNVKHVELVRDNMEQIEGVCFAPDGTMYISSEGVSKKGRIFAFEPI